MTNRLPTPPDARTVIVGVDTHTHVHVAVAIDSWGSRLRDSVRVIGRLPGADHVDETPRAD